jgi:transcriptional regulator with XRE-family HTH domain
MVEMEMGAILRTARQAAGLSLAAMAGRTNYSKAYLGRVETGQRRTTPDLVEAYDRALGDDLERRQLLIGLMAGAVTPTATAEAVAAAFEAALNGPRLSVDDWSGRAEAYGHDYMSIGAGELQARLASDLVRLRERLDNPRLCSIAARLLTVHGKTLPTADDRQGAIHWYQLGITAADRSEDPDVRVWTRGRAALALAYEGAALPTARAFAEHALAISDRPSLGRLNGQLALAHVEGLEGDRTQALATLDEARRTFDQVGSEEQISDFAIPEWRMATISSMLLSRLGEETRAIEAQETADRNRPDTLPRFATHIELHRGLMMARAGDKQAGITYARRAMAALPPERHSLSLRLMLAEIER